MSRSQPGQNEGSLQHVMSRLSAIRPTLHWNLTKTGFIASSNIQNHMYDNSCLKYNDTCVWSQTERFGAWLLCVHITEYSCELCQVEHSTWNIYIFMPTHLWVVILYVVYYKVSELQRKYYKHGNQLKQFTYSVTRFERLWQTIRVDLIKKLGAS